ncbi:MAG: class I SAM-dependent methyltransferase [Acidobacteria bacterium]|nr:class I SAM-dependent methyltransferase [Acidobacteriota bacterium]
MNDNERRSASFWDRRAATYGKTEAENSQLHTAMVERSLMYLGSDDVALDFGCGTGALSYRFAPHVKALHGVDISRQMINAAKDRADQEHVEGLHFSDGSIFNEVFQPDTYDVILTSQVLHVLSNRDGVVSRIHRLVKPGGWFLSTTPCMNES